MERERAQPARADLHGDALPPGAVARLGTVRFRTHEGRAAAVSRDGHMLAVGAWGRTDLYDLRAPEPEGSPGAMLDRRGCRAAFSPDARLVAAGMGDLVVLLDAASGGARAYLPGHAGQLRALAFSPDGRLLASASDDTTALVWDVAAAVGGT